MTDKLKKSFSQIVLNFNDTQLREFIEWSGDDECEFYCTKHVFSSIFNRCYKDNDLETIKYTWVYLKIKCNCDFNLHLKK